LAIGFIVVALVLTAARAMMPWLARKYVNRTLDQNALYAGDIGEVRIHLWRGAYSIENVRVSKVSGNTVAPFFSAKRVDFAMQWSALIHGRAVGRVLMDQPELNFVHGSEEVEGQTGADGAWLQMIRDLFPFKINRAIIHDGKIHFRSYKLAKPVDVYLSAVEGTIDNLSNIRDDTNPLVSTVQVKGQVMDQARLELKMTLDPFSYRPTFHLAMRLLGLDVTKINDLALAYGKFDFQRGWFDFVLEADAKEGRLTGYAKPLFRDLKVFSLTEELKRPNPLQFFWQALVGGATGLLKNYSRDQFGTLIPFTGDMSGTTTAEILATIGNLLRNAFIRAYLPRLEGGQDPNSTIQFETPQFNEALSVEDSS
jgi:hypothetical protein